MKFLSFEILYIFFNFQILKLLNFNFFLENFDPLPMVYRPLYPWNIDPPTHGISTPLPMVFWPPTHGILTPLSMVYWPPYPWDIKPSTHGILTPLSMVYRPPYPWYIESLTHNISTPPIHGILTPLPIEYCPPPTTWYFDLPAYLLIRNGGVQNTMGVQFTIQGGSVFNKGVQYTMDVNRPWVQNTIWHRYYEIIVCDFFGKTDKIWIQKIIQKW